MSTLSFLLATHTDLSGEDVAHLQRLASEWQLLSDLSFADFLLWVPVTVPQDGADGPAGRGYAPTFLCVAHSRPTTAPTAHPDDMVGGTATAAQHPQLLRALGDTTMRREEQPRWHRGRSVRREVVPVGHEGRVIAVLGRDTNLAVPRVPSTLEIAYLAVAGDLCQMIADGTFPTAETADEGRSMPRVGDGLVRRERGRHGALREPERGVGLPPARLERRAGGRRPADRGPEGLGRPLRGRRGGDQLRDALAGSPSTRVEVEGRGATAIIRALPLRPRGVPSGALVLVRDVTEVRRRDRALMSKDATIREIHHRVKNNLQTVAALLRLQARRTRHDEARSR